MKGDGLLAGLRSEEESMVKLLRTLVDMDTPSGDKQRLDEAMEVVQREVERRGAAVTRHTQAEVGDHLTAHWPGSPGSTSVLLAAHLDTVWPAGEALARPFADNDGRLVGPGVFDMKAGLVQAIFAIDAFRKGPDGNTCDVTLLVTSDEESGSRTSRPLIEAEAAASDVVFIMEPAAGPKLKTARKGIGMYSVRVEGRAAHAGLDPELGRSAILELARQIIRLHELTDHDSGTTVTVGKVTGGTARNVVPAYAEATVDLRVVTAEAAERLDGVIRGLLPFDSDTKVTVEGGINRPPMERSAATASLYERAESIAHKLGLQLGEAMVGGGSDGNFTAAQGIPTLDGLGAVGGGAHSLDEHVQRSEVAVRAALVAHLLVDLGRNGPAWKAKQG